MLTPEQAKAICRYERDHRDRDEWQWRKCLKEAWLTGQYEPFANDYKFLLQQIRNDNGLESIRRPITCIRKIAQEDRE